MVIDYPSLSAVLCKSQQSRWSCEVQQLNLLCFTALCGVRSQMCTQSQLLTVHIMLLCVFSISIFCLHTLVYTYWSYPPCIFCGLRIDSSAQYTNMRQGCCLFSISNSDYSVPHVLVLLSLVPGDASLIRQPRAQLVILSGCQLVHWEVIVHPGGLPLTVLVTVALSKVSLSLRGAAH